MRQIIEILGKQIGNLKVISLVEEGQLLSKNKYLCKCSCNNETIITRKQIVSKKIKNCPMCKHKKSKHENPLNKKFGRLTVLSFSGKKLSNGGYAFICKCDCGNIAEVGGYRLKHGKTKSCGCLAKEATIKSSILRRLPTGIPGFRKVYFDYKRNAKKNNRIFSLTEEEAYTLFTSNCHYCNSLPKNICSPSGKTYSQKGKENAKFIYSGIDRKDSSKGYIIDNVVSCCKICNYAKNNLSYDEFKMWINELIKFQTKDNNNGR